MQKTRQTSFYNSYVSQIFTDENVIKDDGIVLFLQLFSKLKFLY